MKLLALLTLAVPLCAQTTTGGLNVGSRLNLKAQPFTIELPNSSTGTTNNKLAKVVNTAGVLQAQIITTSAADQASAIGCVISGGGTSGTALIMIAGTGSCYFDAATTAGHIAVPSSTSAGALHDTGSASTPATGEVMATTGATNACGSPPCLIAGNLFMTPDVVATGSAGNGGGGGNGNRSFKNIDSGTNTTAAMVVGSGATLGVSGSGTINATELTNTNKNIRTIGAILTPSGLTSCIYVAFAGTIQTGAPYGFHAVTLDGATSSTVLIKVLTQPTFATFLSTGVGGASDISNGGEQLTAVLGKVDTTLTSWTLPLTAGTTVCFVASTFSAGAAVNAEINVLATN